jgi:aspartate/methionine/tyrosine aminotransferase
LHEADFSERRSLWPVAEEKLVVYRENREIMLQGFEANLGAYPNLFHWTVPMAGFFSVFTFVAGTVRTDDEFIRQMVTDYGLVVIPMYDFYPPDARIRNPSAGFNQLRISFCFSESAGEQRRKDLREAVETFCRAVKKLAGVS